MASVGYVRSSWTCPHTERSLLLLSKWPWGVASRWEFSSHMGKHQLIDQLKLLTNVALCRPATAPWYFPWMWAKHGKTEFSPKNVEFCHQQVLCFLQNNVEVFTPKTWEFFLSPGPSILGPRPIVHEGLPGFCLRC